MKRLWTPWRMAIPDRRRHVPFQAPAVSFAPKSGAPDESEHVLYRGQFAFITLNRYPYNNGHS